MVAKINRGASIYGALIYNQEKVNTGNARIISGNRMMVDVTANPENVMQQTLFSFEPLLAANRNTRQPILHISLNPTNHDHLNDEQFASLAKDYMEKMNYGNQPYIVYIHEDIDRRHIHIVSLCIDDEGRKIDDAYEHRRSMTACRELETKYGLEKITDERKETDRLFLQKVDYQKGDVKHQISNVLKYALDYKFTTFGEYSALLSLFNVESKTVNGVGVNGKPFNGIVYSATDDMGKAVSNPFKSSLFGKAFGHEKLNKKMERNAKDLKEGKYAPLIRGDISSVMKTEKDKEDFMRKLREKGIDAVFRTNDEGRLYGATFIDHNRKEVYNGSQLGKDFSANVFHKLFNESQNRDSSDKNDSNEKHINHENHNQNNISDIGGLFDLFTPNSGNDITEDIAEQDLIRRLRKKKRKQQRHL